MNETRNTTENGDRAGLHLRALTRSMPALLSLAMALALTGLAWIAVANKVERDVSTRLSASVEHAAQDLSEHLELVAGSLRAAQSLLAIEADVTEKHFEDFLATLDPIDRSPELVSLSLITPLGVRDESQSESSLAISSGFSRVSVRSFYPEYVKGVLELDVSPDLRAAMDDSRDANTVSIAHEGLLKAKASTISTVTLLLCISQNPLRDHQADQQSMGVESWIAAEVAMESILEHVHGELNLPARLAMVDHAADGTHHPIAAFGLPDATPDELVYHIDHQFSIESHDCVAHIEATSDFASLVGAGLPTMVLLLGSLLSAVAFWVPLSIIRRRDDRYRLSYKPCFTIVKGIVVVTLAAGIINGTANATGLRSSPFIGHFLTSTAAAILAMPLLYLWAVKPLEAMLADRIRESERNEEAVRHSENRLRRFMDRAPVMIWLTDANGSCQHSNALIHEYTGQTRESFTQDGWSTMIHPDNKDWMESQWKKAFSTTKNFLAEVRIQNARGDYRWALMQGCPYFDEENVLEGYICTCTDITDQKVAEEGLDIVQRELQRRVIERTEALAQTNARLEMEISEKRRTDEELRHSEASLKAAQRMAHLGNWVWDIAADTLTWSDEIYRMFGHPPRSFAASYERLLESIHPEDREKVTCAVDLALQGQVDYRVEHRILRPDGKIRTVLERGEITRDEVGTPIRMVGTVLDITERKEAEDAQRQSEERVRLLLDSTAEAIYGLDLEGCCTFCNTACIELLGYGSPEDLLGLHMHDIIHHSHASGTPMLSSESKILEASKQGEKAHADDEVIWRADSTSFPAEYWSFPVRQDGELIGSVVTFIDITNRKKAEQALQDAHDELERRVTDRTAELRKAANEAKTANNALKEKIDEMETFNTLAIGRELRMIELKQEINQLLADLDRDPLYAPLEEEQLS